jgi:hypothetical protein
MITVTITCIFLLLVVIKLNSRIESVEQQNKVLLNRINTMQEDFDDFLGGCTCCGDEE